MLYWILKLIFKVALFIFFRRIEVRNKHFIPSQGPLILAANHPNTFMDPIAVAAATKHEVHFITKGTVFQSWFVKWLLEKGNLIPIYRREDGVMPITGNDPTFQKCFKILKKRGAIMIFPEGTSINERRLRPLKTGTARIALDAETQLNYKDGVQIVPVGLNYSDATRFRSKLFINIGEPIKVADYVDLYKQDTFKAAQMLTGELRTQLEELMIITDTTEEDTLLQQIEIIYKDYLTETLGLTRQQKDSFVLTKSMAESIQYFNEHEPARVKIIKEKVNRYEAYLKKLGLQDRYLKHKNNNLLANAFYTLLYLILGLPVFLWGVITNYIPYIIPSKLADKLSFEQEFRAPIMMTAGIFTFAFYYALEILAFDDWLGSGWATALFAISLPVSGFFALHYNYRFNVTYHYLKLLSVFYKRNTLFNQALQQRTAIINSLEEAKRIYLQKMNTVKNKVT